MSKPDPPQTFHSDKIDLSSITFDADKRRFLIDGKPFKVQLGTKEALLKSRGLGYYDEKTGKYYMVEEAAMGLGGDEACETAENDSDDDEIKRAALNANQAKRSALIARAMVAYTTPAKKTPWKNGRAKLSYRFKADESETQKFLTALRDAVVAAYSSTMEGVEKSKIFFETKKGSVITLPKEESQLPLFRYVLESRVSSPVKQNGDFDPEVTMQYFWSLQNVKVDGDEIAWRGQEKAFVHASAIDAAGNALQSDLLDVLLDAHAASGIVVSPGIGFVPGNGNIYIQLTADMIRLADSGEEQAPKKARVQASAESFVA